jgi:hypothetical protein
MVGYKSKWFKKRPRKGDIKAGDWINESDDEDDVQEIDQRILKQREINQRLYIR